MSGKPFPCPECNRTAALDVICIECCGTARCVGGDRIYPHRPDLYAKRFWLCSCGAYCGCHGVTERPLGHPCGPETREARKAAHAIFDPIWRGRKLSRSEAYAWLAGQLNIEPEDCHIGMMTAERAWCVVEVVSARQRSAAA